MRTGSGPPELKTAGLRVLYGRLVKRSDPSA